MTIKKLVAKYLTNTRRVLKHIDQQGEFEESLRKVFDRAKRYFDDALYYNEKNQFETALSSVVYCEGLLDAMRLLELVDFKWEQRETARRPSLVLAAGVFDLLHLGHVRFLEEAKKTGGNAADLVVIVARDKTVEERKGEKPVMPENQRRALVESLEVVDEAILGYENFDIHRVLEKIKPDIIVLGYDQRSLGVSIQRAVKGLDFPVKIIRVGKFSEDELDSSTEIKRKIIGQHKREH